MDLTLASVTALMRDTLVAPRDTATRIMDMNPPDDARWLGFRNCRGPVCAGGTGVCPAVGRGRVQRWQPDSSWRCSRP